MRYKQKAAPRSTYAQAESAWDFGITGENVRVAILDSGVSPAVPTLAGAVTASHDFTGGASQDLGWGGSYIASVAAGRVAPCQGVAPGASVVSARVSKDWQPVWEVVRDAAEWAFDQKCGIVCMPFTPGVFDSLSPPASHSLYRLMISGKALFVVPVEATCSGLTGALPPELRSVIRFSYSRKKPPGPASARAAHTAEGAADLLVPGWSPTRTKTWLTGLGFHNTPGASCTTPPAAEGSVTRGYAAPLEMLTACGLVAGALALVLSFVELSWPEGDRREQLSIARMAVCGNASVGPGLAPESLNVLRALDWASRFLQAKRDSRPQLPQGAGPSPRPRDKVPAHLSLLTPYES